MGILVEPHRVNRSQSRRRYTVSSVSQPPLPRFLFLKPYSRNQRRQTSADRKKTPAAQTFLSLEATRQAISAPPIQRRSIPAYILQSPSIGAWFKKFQVIQHWNTPSLPSIFWSISVDWSGFDCNSYSPAKCVICIRLYISLIGSLHHALHLFFVQEPRY
jgi:hypothetical protein